MQIHTLCSHLLVQDAPRNLASRVNLAMPYNSNTSCNYTLCTPRFIYMCNAFVM